MLTFQRIMRPAAALAASAALLLTGVAGPALAVGPAATGPTAVSVLNTLPVKGKAASTGYNRDKYGAAWADADKNGCDTRNDILARDLTSDVFADKKKCVIASGTLQDPYTGKTIKHVRGGNKVDIDHVVALGQSWVSGGQALSAAQRLAFANDPLNLLAVDASANRAKSASEASAWLPANKAQRCMYVATQIAVKKKYVLSVTAAEKTAMASVLKSCPGQKTVKVTPIKPAGTSAPAPKPAPTPAPSVQQVSPGAFCTVKNAKGIGKTNGKPYVCKTSPTENRLRWRAA